MFGGSIAQWALQVITGQAAKLSRLLSQLLDISRLEAGKLTLERQPTDLALLVEHILSGRYPS